MDDEDIKRDLAYHLASTGICQQRTDIPSKEVSRELLESGLRHLNLGDRIYLPYMRQPITRGVMLQQMFNLVLI